MSVLVTGGTGFVGGAVVRALMEKGEKVRVLARKTSKTEHLREKGVEIVYGDILDKGSVENALSGCNTLFHAAALYDLWGLNEQELMKIEIEGTRNALDAALSLKIGKVIYTSTALTIGERTGEVGNETTKHRGYFLSKYERAKYEAEQVAASYVENGLSVIMVNPAGVYGPGDFKPTGRAIIDILNGRMPGLFKGINSFVYLDDVGRGHVIAAEKGRFGEPYILSGDSVTLKEWGNLICQLSGAKMPPSVPRFLAYMTAFLGEIVSRFTGRPPVLSLDSYGLVSHGFQVDGSKAAEELGMQYTPFEKGMRRTIKWYWEQGLLKRKPVCVRDG